MSNAPKDARPPGMSFDLFVQACISLKRQQDLPVNASSKLRVIYPSRSSSYRLKTSVIRFSKDARPPGMSFDLFVQACISLKRMTDVFKRYDEEA
jgi:hypothetical protein